MGVWIFDFGLERYRANDFLLLVIPFRMRRSLLKGRPPRRPTRVKADNTEVVPPKKQGPLKSKTDSEKA
jgi:hypothetical protein